MARLGVSAKAYDSSTGHDRRNRRMGLHHLRWIKVRGHLFCHQGRTFVETSVSGQKGVLRFLLRYRSRATASAVPLILHGDVSIFEEIANALHMSTATAKTHVSRVLMKLTARDREQLVVIAYELGFTTPG